MIVISRLVVLIALAVILSLALTAVESLIVRSSYWAAVEPLRVCSNMVVVVKGIMGGVSSG